MTRKELKDGIILKLTPSQRVNWGEGANKIQDVAEQVLSKKDFREYLIKSSEDMSVCEGQDGVLFNGQYFDWKQFDYMSHNILDAFLDYFTDNSLKRIYLVL